ncbi:fumarate reductase subunit C [Roseateles violae]|uniref:Fumarate reductase subunit C n=1 Tax=Roseateles violae TaxID=3058042 RepID=A0ABT8DRD3_9BURK|nr:fumarate reductase subunit C [Pelomonas sp. PFR6]MDN3920900.1 fumarate reductase subunit C [Pelomonas sp. PFR6]
MTRKPYKRPMSGWWKRDPFFVRYMWREATALGVLAYAIVLMTGVWRLAQGPEAFEGWLQALRSWPALVFHLLLLVAMVYHTISWFEIMPKTMPMMFVGGERVAATTITRVGMIAAAAALVLLLLAWMLKP